MKRRFALLIVGLLCLVPVGSQPVPQSATQQTTKAAPAAAIELVAGTQLVFADAATGRRLALTADDYSRRTSALERQLKVRSASPVSEADYLAELARDVRDWTDEERGRVAAAVALLREPMGANRLPLPPHVSLVRMSGRVIGETVAYTRGDAIYLPVGMVGADNPPQALASLLAHELFHVASRRDRRWRDAMYAAVGFEPMAELTLPASLAARSIVNPDAPRLDSAIRVTVADRGSVWVVPLLQSRIDRVDGNMPAHFMQVLGLRWLEVGRGERLPERASIESPPVLHDTAALDGFYERIGRNTKYILHPEEILASNYEQMVVARPSSTSLASPEVHARMRAVMREHTPR